ncbi:MAG: M61 family metallopeptidase [Luteibaculum sp.]
MHYSYSYQIPTRHFIHVEFSLPNPHPKQQLLTLPFWRPGRYERGNFAKNIQEFHVYNEEGKKLDFHKETSHDWLVDTKGAKEIKVSYNYYAADLNAGSSYVDKGFLYVNPVNLSLYAKGREDEPCTLSVSTEENLRPFGALPKSEGGAYQFSNFHHLADTPFFYASRVETHSLEVKGLNFHMHFWGYVQVQQEKLLRDFKKFIAFTLNLFPEAPFKDYHFLFFGMPNSFHHGVEHLESTVIALGPGHSIFTSDYDEFLSISCHELYHAWNVKSIRPIEFWPYNYNKESYSRLGYLCEGVTTYMGNLLLFQSGVWKFNQLADEFDKFLDRHFNNFGRFNLSVAESSFDTWLDGYERGIPNRKVSIYNEGALISFFADCIIRSKHKGEKSLHDVMETLYSDYYLKGLGVSEEDYWKVLKDFGGKKIKELYNQYVAGTGDFHQPLDEAFDYLGIEYIAKPSRQFNEAHLGFKMTKNSHDRWEITAIYPGSPAETMGLYVGDQMLLLNNVQAQDDFVKWMEFFQNDTLEFTVQRNGMVKKTLLNASERVFYKDYTVQRLENPSRAQREAFNKWSYKK